MNDLNTLETELKQTENKLMNSIEKQKTQKQHLKKLQKIVDLNGFDRNGLHDQTLIK
jgi:hypothetical protein